MFCSVQPDALDNGQGESGVGREREACVWEGGGCGLFDDKRVNERDRHREGREGRIEGSTQTKLLISLVAG